MIRPTNRGLATGVVVVLAITLAWLFGARSLNAVAAPAIVALLAAGVQMRLASDPTLEREPLSAGFPGETRPVSLSIEGGSTVVDVLDGVPAALHANGNRTAAAPPTTVTYDLEYTTRGVHTVGPTIVRVRDILGLFERELRFSTEAEVVVYPRVYTLGSSGDLSRLLSRAVTTERDEFEDLREYVPGDPLRDVHWKSTAKHPEELLVKEFAGREPEGAIEIAMSSHPVAIEETAAAAASIAVALLDAGLAVALDTPSGSVSTDEEHVDRVALLTLLARTEPGRVDEDAWADADVTIGGQRYGDVEVTVDDRTTRFDQWRTGGGNPLVEPSHGEDRVVSAT